MNKKNTTSIQDLIFKEKIDSQSETTQTVSALKLPVLKTGDYDLWSIRMEQYLTHIDYALWEVIVNGDAPSIASASAGTEGPIPPKTTEQKLARKNKLKAKSTLLLAIPDEHLLKSEGLDKTYDRFQKLISQLEIHGEVISQEDANLKLLRSLPSAWNNIALIMRNKSDLDTLSMDDLYNNLKVYESKIKGQSSSSSNSQNVAFVSSENTSSTNEAVNTAHEVSTASSQGQASSSTYADDVIFSFFANQSNSPQLDNEDLEQIDTDDLEEMDLKWQKLLALIRQRLNVTTATGEVTLLENVGHQGIRGIEMEMLQEGMHQWIHLLQMPWLFKMVYGGYDWSFQAEEGITNFALMAYTSQGSSSSSSSDSEVHTCSKDCLKSYETLQKQYDQQREALNKSNLEIIGYQMGLESLEARIVVHERMKLVNNVTTAGPKAVVSAAVGYGENAVKSSARWIWRPNRNTQFGCSRHMTGNKSFLIDYQKVDGGFVVFVESPKGGKITGKDKIRIRKLDFEDVYFVKELKFNLFSVSQMCDKKNSVLFIETEWSRPDWLFDIDLLTNSMNYEPVTAGNQTNKNAEDAVANDAGKNTNEEPANEGERNGQEKEGGASNKEDDQNVQDVRVTLDNLLVQQKKGYANSTNRDSTVSPSISTARQSFTNADDLPTDPLIA
ncbi:hypothetical protein Tco_0366931 [Tanacetum coccineum]